MINLGKLSLNGKEVILEEIENGCIECISHCKDDCGYTRVNVNGKHERLFRYIYENKYGKIPKGLVLRHLCNNPSCCNIKHLKVGTYKENYQDMVNCGRSLKGKPNVKARGTKSPFHKLSEKQVEEIYLSNLSFNELSKIYKVSSVNIGFIKHKKQWKWLTDKIDNIK